MTNIQFHMWLVVETIIVWCLEHTIKQLPLIRMQSLFSTVTGVFNTQVRYSNRNLKEQEIEQSMSRVGHCIDNGPTEGFWGIIKTEMYKCTIYRWTSLRFAINDYMRFYSEERPQDRYYCKTPLEVRTEALASDNPKEYPIPENKRIKKYKEKWCA